jgi:hypothetical protein
MMVFQTWFQPQEVSFTYHGVLVVFHISAVKFPILIFLKQRIIDLEKIFRRVQDIIL